MVGQAPPYPLRYANEINNIMLARMVNNLETHALTNACDRNLHVIKLQGACPLTEIAGVAFNVNGVTLA